MAFVPVSIYPACFQAAHCRRPNAKFMWWPYTEPSVAPMSRPVARLDKRDSKRMLEFIRSLFRDADPRKRGVELITLAEEVDTTLGPLLRSWRFTQVNAKEHTPLCRSVSYERSGIECSIVHDLQFGELRCDWRRTGGFEPFSSDLVFSLPTSSLPSSQGVYTVEHLTARLQLWRELFESVIGSSFDSVEALVKSRLDELRHSSPNGVFDRVN